MPCGMPVLSQHHVTEQPAETIDGRYHLVAARHHEGAAGTEIVLHVDYQEEIGVGDGGHALGHRDNPLCARVVDLNPLGSVIASEAKQSRRVGFLDCFVAALLAMTAYKLDARKSHGHTNRRR